MAARQSDWSRSGTVIELDVEKAHADDPESEAHCGAHWNQSRAAGEGSVSPEEAACKGLLSADEYLDLYGEPRRPWPAVKDSPYCVHCLG